MFGKCCVPEGVGRIFLPDRRFSGAFAELSSMRDWLLFLNMYCPTSNSCHWAATDAMRALYLLRHRASAIHHAMEGKGMGMGTGTFKNFKNK